VFLDEPVSSLDPEGRRDLLELIAALRGEVDGHLSTHVLADVERVCDRVAILDRGRLVIEGPLEGLLAEHARPVFLLDPDPGQDAAVDGLVTRLGGAPWTTAVTTGPDGRIRVVVADADEASARILPLVVEAGVRLASFERARPTLEDVFLELVRTAGPGRPRRSRVRPSPGGGPVMAGAGTLLRKELLEQWRTLRLPLTAIVFVLIGLSSPVLARFTPELLQAVGGNLIPIVLPTPTAADAVAQLAKNLTQLGALVGILLAAGSVAAEKERGTAALLLVRPVSRPGSSSRSSRRSVSRSRSRRRSRSPGHGSTRWCCSSRCRSAGRSRQASSTGCSSWPGSRSRSWAAP
jgi:hypothetical protein